MGDGRCFILTSHIFLLVGEALNPNTMALYMFDPKYTSWLLFWEL